MRSSSVHGQGPVRTLCLVACLAALGLVSGCDSKPAAPASEKKPGASAAVDKKPAAGEVAEASAGAPAKAIEGTYEVACGCSLEHVGHCSEHAKVDGEYLPLTFPAEMKMGHMPFCGKEGLKAQIAGKVVDGRLVAERFAYAGEAGDKADAAADGAGSPTPAEK